MLPSRRKITNNDIQLLLKKGLDNEFMDDISRSQVLDTSLNLGVSDSIILVNIQRKFALKPKV